MSKNSLDFFFLSKVFRNNETPQISNETFRSSPGLSCLLRHYYELPENNTIQLSNQFQPIVSVCVSRRLFPAFIGFGIQKTVIGVDRVAKVIPELLLI